MEETGTGTDDGRFKVIIVGAGVGGLYLAHALAKADINYVVLDKHAVAPAWGSGISLYPSGVRLLDQVGLHDVLAAQMTEMHDFHVRGPDGKTFASGPFFGELAAAAGYYAMTFERRVFLQTLYDALPDKSRVVEHARVAGLVEEAGRVRVVLADGGVHEGDVVVGCDGIHSAVRRLLWERAHRLCPGLVTVEEKQRIRASYTGLVGVAPYQPGGVGGLAMSSASHHGFSFLFLTQPDALYFSVFIRRLPGGGGNGSGSQSPGGGPSKYPNRLRFTDADADAVAARLADCPVSETLVFGDIWQARTRGQLVALEEGVLSHWFLGRTALCGDSAHKFTPNAGFGGNLSLEGAAVLANELHAAVEAAKKRGATEEDEEKQQQPPQQKPTDEAIRRALANYQDAQRPRAEYLYKVGWIWTRMQAYDGWGWYVAQRWILPMLLLTSARYVAGLVAGAPKLSFVPFHEKSGKIPWEKQRWERPEEEGKTGPQTKSLGRTVSSGLVALVVLSVCIFLSYSAGAWYLGLGRGVKTSLD